jgi:hypothetical protein
MYESEHFKFKFVRIESKISGLSEVESASFFLSSIITNLWKQARQEVRQHWFID